MKVKDLRVGNSVWKDISVDDLIEVTLNIGDLALFALEDENTDYPTLIPIVLIKERLENLGFEKGRALGQSLNYYYYRVKGRVYGYRAIITDEGVHIQKDTDKGYVHLCTVEHVHHLQNLYYFLEDGEELTFKKTTIDG